MRLPLSSIVVHFGPTLCCAAMIALAGGCSNADAKAKGGKMTIQITSSAFTQGQPIPKKYTGDGVDVSPPLAWSNLPTGVKELALICDDPDAPNGDWVHWVLYKIPADTKGLPEAVPTTPKLKEPAGALQGKNSWPSTGYRGPAPPAGKPHRYYFKLFALDAPLQAEPGLDKKSLLKKMEGHILGQGEVMGTYKR